jgi:hypothetical protein
LPELGDEEQYGGTDRGVDDRAGSSGTEMDTKLRNQLVASESAKKSEYDVSNSAAGSTNTETFDPQVHSGPLTEIRLISHKAGPDEPQLTEGRLQRSGRGIPPAGSETT